MDDAMDVKVFLDECNHEIVDPALETGLSPDFYFEYLVAICSVTPASRTARVEYDKKRNLAFEKTIEMFDSDPTNVHWLDNCLEQYELQWTVMNGLMDKIERYARHDARTTAMALIDFMIIQLEHQNRFLHSFLYFSPSKALFAGRTEVTDRYATAMTSREKVSERVRSLRDKLAIKK